jgi:hypothetical protein
VEIDSPGSGNGAGIDNPPVGAWFERTFDGFVVGAATSSLKASVLIALGALGVGAGIYWYFLRDWPGSASATEIRIVGVSFLAVCAALAAGALIYSFGRVIVTVSGHRGEVFTGLGPVGLTKHFNWLDVTEVREATYRDYESEVGKDGLRTYKVIAQGGIQKKIILEGKRRISFGGWLNNRRRTFILRVIQKMLAERDRNK